VYAHAQPPLGAPEYALKTDSQLQQDVTDELNWDAAIEANKIDVYVKDGSVTLGGEVTTLWEKWEAERAVRHVSGVKSLVIQLTVAPIDERSDADIAHAAQNVLAWMSSVPRDAVKIQVEKGWVTLSGEVDWDYQRRSAAGAVRYLAGVKGVTNDISIETDSPAGQIKESIEAALERFDGTDQQITVSVSGRTVTLSGNVASWWQRDRARDSAWNAPGVQHVTDHLVINSPS
jgi:osmotically-inducible protein OsmY